MKYRIYITATIENKTLAEASVDNLSKEECTLDNPHAVRLAWELQNKYPKAKVVIW